MKFYEIEPGMSVKINPAYKTEIFSFDVSKFSNTLIVLKKTRKGFVQVKNNHGETLTVKVRFLEKTEQNTITYYAVDYKNCKISEVKIVEEIKEFGRIISLVDNLFNKYLLVDTFGGFERFKDKNYPVTKLYKTKELAKHRLLNNIDISIVNSERDIIDCNKRIQFLTEVKKNLS